MNNITQQIKARRSVRTYDGKALDESTKEKLLTFMEDFKNPYNIPVEFKLLDAEKDGLTCPVVSGTDLYIGGKIAYSENANVAFGYSFEAMVLYAQSLGVGTVWLGGTMNRPAYEQAMKLAENEIMPCASALGYTAKKMSLKESMMRKAIKADERLPFEELFFDGSFDTTLTKEKAGKFKEPLEMVRLAPSAVNKQPWRVVVADNTAHFYLRRSKKFSGESKLDMQMTDMGIALCHFELTAKEKGLNVTFVQENPKLMLNDDTKYVASYTIK